MLNRFLDEQILEQKDSDTDLRSTTRLDRRAKSRASEFHVRHPYERRTLTA